MPISMFGCTVTDCNSIGTYLDPRFSLSRYITGKLHVYEQVGPSQIKCNNVIEQKREKNSFSFRFFFNLTCIRTSLGSCFCLCLSLNVGNVVRLYYDSLYVRIRLCIVVVCLFRNEYLY